MLKKRNLHLNINEVAEVANFIRNNSNKGK